MVSWRLGFTRPDPSGFSKLSQKVFELYGRGEYAAALKLLEKEVQKYADQAARIDYWRMCFLSLMGKPDKARGLFEAVLKRGEFLPEAMLLNDPDLDALRALGDLEDLMAHNKKRREQAQASVHPYIEMHPPDNDPPFPALIAIHGNASSVAMARNDWLPAVQHNWLVALPQSTQIDGPGWYSWNDTARAEKDVMEHVEHLMSAYPVDKSRVVLGGFSRGGSIACRLVFGGMIRAAGLVLVSAYLNDLDEWQARVKSVQEPLTVTLIAGDADGRAVQQNQRLAGLLREAGAEVDLQIYPNMGHAFPDDWKKVLGRALGVLAHS